MRPRSAASRRWPSASRMPIRWPWAGSWAWSSSRAISYTLRKRSCSNREPRAQRPGGGTGPAGPPGNTPADRARLLRSGRRTPRRCHAHDPVINAIAISEGRMSPATLGIEAPDERTVRVHLNAPTPYLLSLLTKSYTVPQYEAAIRAHGESWVRPGYLVNNGAFLLREHVIGGPSKPRLDPPSLYFSAEPISAVS